MVSIKMTSIYNNFTQKIQLLLKKNERPGQRSNWFRFFLHLFAIK